MAYHTSIWVRAVSIPPSPMTTVSGGNDHGQECGRRQQPLLGVLSADQCFGTNQLAAVHIHLGLVVQHKFALRQRQTDALQAFVMAANTTVAAPH